MEINVGADTRSLTNSIKSRMSDSALGNPIDKIEEIIKRATNETGDGGDSDAEGTGFEIMNDLTPATRNSEDHKLLNNYDEAEMNVDNVKDNHTMSYDLKTIYSSLQ